MLMKHLLDKISLFVANIAVYAYLLGGVLCVPTVIYYARLGSTVYSIYIILLSLLLSSVIACLLCVRNIIFKCMKLVLAVVLLFLCVVFVNGQIRFGLALPIDSLAPVAQTNNSEALEFIEENLCLALLGFLFFLTALIIIWFLIFRDVKNVIFARLLTISYVITLVVSIFAIVRNPVVIDDFMMCNNVAIIFENSVDLREHLTNPEVGETTPNHPRNIVLIIGESYTKYHSSLYGYNKPTNPCLQRYVDDGSLVVFDSIESPCLSTTPTFMFLLNTHTRNKKGKWYESVTIQEFFHNAGYHLTWISNQQQFGAFNNIPSGQSMLCDESYFHGGEGQTMDMNVVDTYNSLNNNYEYNFYFFHLYGQHPQFNKRYPQSFCQFKPEDYLTPQNQKPVLAAYDNATLYNDSVVSAIFSCFKNKDALVIYLSDHGLDLFYTDPYYYAHGRPTDQKSDKIARQVPFMVYMSESFRLNHPGLSSCIMEAKSIPFCTEILIYKLLSFTGYKIEENEHK